jgi:hypothetical protein
MGHLAREINQHLECESDDRILAKQTTTILETSLYLPQTSQKLPSKVQNLVSPLDEPSYWYLLFSWIFTHKLGEIFCEDNLDVAIQSHNIIDEWLLGKIIAKTFTDLALPFEQSQERVNLLKVLIAQQNWYTKGSVKKGKARKFLKKLLNDPEIQSYLRINRFEGILWFNKEAFDQLINGLLMIAIVSILSDSDLSQDQAETRVKSCIKIISRIQKAGKKSEFQVTKLIKGTKK